MSENLKTIKELADELGVSKQNLQYHVKFLPTKKRQKNESGIVVLNIEEQMFISGRIKKNKAKDINDETKKGQKNINEETKKRQKNNDVFAFNNHLLKEIIVKDKQLENKDSQISQMQNLLDQQQRLALQDKKLLEEYKAENDSLKALKMPSQETEFKHLDNQYKDEVNALKEKLENLQEQIKDQKRIEEQEKPRKWWGLWRK